MDMELRFLLDKTLPKGRTNFGIEAVEMLAQIIWDAAKKHQKVEDAEEEFERQHGPRFI
jgi:hypothetical protein